MSALRLLQTENHVTVFQKSFERHLRALIAEQPNEFHWTPEELPRVLARMFMAIELGTFNKDTITMKRVCKELGLKHTYKSILEYLHS